MAAGKGPAFDLAGQWRVASTVMMVALLTVAWRTRMNETLERVEEAYSSAPAPTPASEPSSWGASIWHATAQLLTLARAGSERDPPFSLGSAVFSPVMVIIVVAITVMLLETLLNLVLKYVLGKAFNDARVDVDPLSLTLVAWFDEYRWYLLRAVVMCVGASVALWAVTGAYMRRQLAEKAFMRMLVRAMFWLQPLALMVAVWVDPVLRALLQVED